MINSRAAEKQNCELIRLPAPGTIPFFDDEEVFTEPSWRLLALGERAEFEAIIDEVDYFWALRWVWFLIPSGYACRKRTRADGPGSNLVWLHREITFRKDPIPHPELYLSDHVNGCTLDVRRENLEWETVSGNNRNKHGIKWRQTRFW